jgi:hypothetical protein
MLKQDSAGALIKVSLRLITVLSGVNFAIPGGRGAVSAGLRKGNTTVGDLGCLFTLFLLFWLRLVINSTYLEQLRFRILFDLSASTFILCPVVRLVTRLEFPVVMYFLVFLELFFPHLHHHLSSTVPLFVL